MHSNPAFHLSSPLSSLTSISIEAYSAGGWHPDAHRAIFPIAFGIASQAVVEFQGPAVFFSSVMQLRLSKAMEHAFFLVPLKMLRAAMPRSKECN